MLEKNWKTILFWAALACAAVLVVNQVRADHDDNVTICHKNNGSGWSQITVDESAVNGQGNGDHNDSGHQNGQDIIPPGSWDGNGRNWTAGNIAIYNNNCNAVVPTSTPQPTVTPTPTVEQEPTPTVTPTEEVTPTPTNEPRVTPTPTGTPNTSHDEVLSNNTTYTPSCSDLTPTRVQDIWVERGIANDGKLLVRWGSNNNYGRVHIRYSEVDGEWRYALLNTDNDGTEEIADLKNGVHYFFQVAYVNGCAVGAFSKSFDPLP